MKPNKVLLALIVLPIVAGCAGREAAQRVARVTIGQTALLEKDVAAKEAAEAKYYKDAGTIITEAAQRESFIEENSLLDQNGQNFARNVLEANRPLGAADLRDYLMQSTLSIWLSRSNLLSQGELESAALTSSLTKLDDKMSVLHQVNQDLEDLQKDPGIDAQGQALFEFFQQIKTDVDKNKK